MTLALAPERIEQWPLVRLQHYAKNAKVHGATTSARSWISRPQVAQSTELADEKFVISFLASADNSASLPRRETPE